MESEMFYTVYRGCISKTSRPSRDRLSPSPKTRLNKRSYGSDWSEKWLGGSQCQAAPYDILGCTKLKALHSAGVLYPAVNRSRSLLMYFDIRCDPNKGAGDHLTHPFK